LFYRFHESQATVDFYQRERGLTGMVVRAPVQPPMDGPVNLSPAWLASRHERYMTIFNPEPGKGGQFFLNIAVLTSTLAPGLESMRAAWADLVQAQGRAQSHRSV
jgi:hypothetical protein